jgi:hypothetical protein
VFPILKNPANRHKAVGFTKEQFHYAFANTQSREDSDEVYTSATTHIPASGRLVWVGATANFTPGHQETYVNFRNEDRAPLAVHSGESEENIMAAGSQPLQRQALPPHAKSVTGYKEFEGRSHYKASWGVRGGRRGRPLRPRVGRGARNTSRGLSTRPARLQPVGRAALPEATARFE